MNEITFKREMDKLLKQASYYDDKIENTTGWWREQDIIRFKKERWVYLKQVKELKKQHPEYLL